MAACGKDNGAGGIASTPVTARLTHRHFPPQAVSEQGSLGSEDFAGPALRWDGTITACSSQSAGIADGAPDIPVAPVMPIVPAIRIAALAFAAGKAASAHTISVVAMVLNLAMYR